jgi:hypothetical protein
MNPKPTPGEFALWVIVTFPGEQERFERLREFFKLWQVVPRSEPEDRERKQ